MLQGYKFRIMLNKKVFVINDTSSEMHHGCSRVMDNLYHLIRVNYGIIIGSSPVGYDWRKSEEVKQKMLASDIVIVNGEGSIHHDSIAGLPLLDVASFCKEYGIKTALVNCLFQSMTNINPAKLKDFDFISVRDSFSQNELSDIGIESTLLPDLTFYSQPKYVEPKDRFGWMYTCSVNIEKSIELSKLSIGKDNGFFEPIIYGKGNWEHNVGKQSLYSKLLSLGLKAFLKKSKDRILALVRSNKIDMLSKICTHNEYHDLIAKTEFIVSGRFHSVCFAINSSIPFVAITSNSHKIEALIKDFGLSDKRIVKSISDLKNINSMPYDADELNNIKNKLSSIRGKYELFYNKIFD